MRARLTVVRQDTCAHGRRGLLRRTRCSSARRWWACRHRVGAQIICLHLEPSCAARRVRLSCRCTTHVTSHRQLWHHVHVASHWGMCMCMGIWHHVHLASHWGVLRRRRDWRHRRRLMAGQHGLLTWRLWPHWWQPWWQLHWSRLCGGGAGWCGRSSGSGSPIAAREVCQLKSTWRLT